MAWENYLIKIKHMYINYTAKFGHLSEPRFHAVVIWDLRSKKLQIVIWAGSISKNVRDRDLHNLAKFCTFVKK